MEPLFLVGSFQEKIWGGSKLRTEFNYDIPSNKTGELWAISAHPNGMAIVKNGEHQGKTLKNLWDEHRELFGNQVGETFPLLTKIIDAQDNLSVQVHPDDSYSLKHEGELGKTECWYILDAEDNAQIIYGHYAQTKNELRELINNNKWKDLLRYEKVKAGDFYYLPSGTIHAIGSGITILETQQSSDTTYRLYDYDRRDNNGNLRSLHIEKSIEVANVPHQEHQSLSKKDEVKNGTVETLLVTDFFSVYKWSISGLAHFKRDSLYTLVSVINGEGLLTIDGIEYSLKKGDHFILPNDVNEWSLDGTIELIASHP